MERTGTTQIYTEQFPPAQEAAILFAAAFEDAARALLEAEIAERPLASRQPWLMLLELHQAMQDRKAFDQLLMRYCKAFKTLTRPDWGYPQPIEAAGTLALRGDLGIAGDHCAEVMKHAAARKALALDMGEVRRIDFEYATRLAFTLRTLHQMNKRVILANIGELAAALLEAVGVEHHAVLMRRKARDGQPLHPAAVGTETGQFAARPAALAVA